MRKWGIVITLLYAATLVILILPSTVLLVWEHSLFWQDFCGGLRDVCSAWGVWLAVCVFVFLQGSLLFLSVDTSWKRLKPRTHVAVTCVIASLLFALLTLAAVFSVDVAAKGDADTINPWARVLTVFAAFWVSWAVILFFYLRNSSAALSRVLTWLLRGSVLELLVAVPSHVIVRRRDDCCAPLFTGLGIVTGIAIMLLSFGPGILFLYKKRLDAYSDRPKHTVS